jgi:hypothetical protein
VRPKFTRFTEETKAEVFWSKKIFQGKEESLAQEGAIATIGSELEKRDLDCLVSHSGSSRREHREGIDMGCQILRR